MGAERWTSERRSCHAVNAVCRSIDENQGRVKTIGRERAKELPFQLLLQPGQMVRNSTLGVKLPTNDLVVKRGEQRVFGIF